MFIGKPAFLPLPKCLLIEPGVGLIFTITFCGNDLIELMDGNDLILPLPCMANGLAARGLMADLAPSHCSENVL